MRLRLVQAGLKETLINQTYESARQKIVRLRRGNDGPLFRSFSLRSTHYAPQTNEKSDSN